MKCHLSLLEFRIWYHCPPVSKHASRNPEGGCVGFYKAAPCLEQNSALAARLWGPWYFSNNLPSMCLSVLDHVVWREGKGRHIPASLHVRSLQIHRDGWLCPHICVCVCVNWRDRSGSNTVMSTWVMVWLTHRNTHTHAHNTFNCQQKKKKKRSVSRAPLCLMCSTLILPFGDICCCVNYTPPGVLINTHAMTCTSLHTEIPNALYVRGSGMNGGAGMSLKYPKLPFKSP